MTSRTASGSRRLLRWTLCRGDEAVTCQIERTVADGSYAVCVVPHRDLSAASIETFDASLVAFQRHAVIVSALRRRGWTMTAYQAAA